MRIRNFGLLIKAMAFIMLIKSCVEGELSETEAFFKFIRAVDPENQIGVTWNQTVPHPCLNYKWKGTVNCNFQATTITEIRLQNLNLRGTIDADSLCKLQNLQVLSLSNNLISGNIPQSISNCRSLTCLDLSSNLLTGRVTLSFSQFRHLRILNISNNLFTDSKHNLRKLFRFRAADESNDDGSLQPPTGSEIEGPKHKKWYKQLLDLMPFILGFAFIFLFLVLIYFVTQRISKGAKDKEFLKSLADSSQVSHPSMPQEEITPDEGRSELVFFVNEQETFKLDDLFEATADLQSHTLYSSLYKVILKNNAVYAVKRFKKLQISFEEFGRTMRQIGSLKHPNILPLIGYNSTSEEKLLIYKYQSSGSLLNLLEDHIAGKKVFPWKHRLSIASGIARGLDFIYHNSYNQNQVIPHGNLKSSNILIDENEEPVISEYGYTRFIDSKTCYLLVCNGYKAPEKTVSEQGDVFSFGIILLELLTGKTVEKSGIDLPKWVRSMVREEWTGEVFDKELNNAAKEYAFPLLNIALKCVSNSAEERPSIAEVMEKIEEVGSVHDDVSISSMASESSPYDFCLLHTVIPETWDTPASNY